MMAETCLSWNLTSMFSVCPSSGLETYMQVCQQLAHLEQTLQPCLFERPLKILVGTWKAVRATKQSRVKKIQGIW